MGIRGYEPFTRRDALMMNPLQLAFLGDTVWDMMTRTRLVYEKQSVHHMHEHAVAEVNASAQAESLKRMEPWLTGEEAELVRRGRNAHARHPAPRNQDPAAYQAATGLETLMGFLYLTGQDERIVELFSIVRKAREEEGHV